MDKIEWDREWIKERVNEFILEKYGEPIASNSDIELLSNFFIYIEDFLANERQKQREALGIKKDEDLTHKERTAQLKEMLERKAEEYYKKTGGFLIKKIMFTYFDGNSWMSAHAVIEQEYK